MQTSGEILTLIHRAETRYHKDPEFHALVDFLHNVVGANPASVALTLTIIDDEGPIEDRISAAVKKFTVAKEE